jgi:hypothetical protein
VVEGSVDDTTPYPFSPNRHYGRVHPTGNLLVGLWELLWVSGAKQALALWNRNPPGIAHTNHAAGW